MERAGEGKRRLHGDYFVCVGEGGWMDGLAGMDGRVDERWM